MRRCLIAMVVAALALSAGCNRGSRPNRVGSAAPEFTLQDSDRTVALNQFRGQVVVLNFWATWCPPCQEELPSMIRMQERVRPRGVVVLGVSIDVDESEYHRFIKERRVNFVTVRDPQQKVASLYGTAGWPETYIIDRQGVLRRKVVGPIDWSAPEMTEFLSRL